MESGHLNFFEVEECGLYTWSKASTPHSMELLELSQQLYDWAIKGNVAVTSLSSIDRTYSPNTKPNCYIYDAHKDTNTGDLFLVLIKSDGSRGEYIKGIDPAQGLGNSDIKSVSSEKDEGRIWGHPCYYWILSKENAVVSIKFPHSLADADMFSCYMKSFVLYKAQSKLLKKTESTSGEWVREFRTEDDNKSLRFRYSMHQFNSVVDDAAIREILPKITHLIKRETVPLSAGKKKGGIVDKIPELKDLSKLLNKRGGKRKQDTVNIEYRIELKPTFAIVKSIVMQSGYNPKEWACMGFIADNRKVFAHEYRLHESIVKPRGEGDIISAKGLSRSLLQRRGEIVIKIRKPNARSKLVSVK